MDSEGFTLRVNSHRLYGNSVEIETSGSVNAQNDYSNTKIKDAIGISADLCAQRHMRYLKEDK